MSKMLSTTISTRRLSSSLLDDNVCSNVTCQHDGTCIRINDYSFRCICDVPYYGDLCQFRNHCYEKPCPPQQECQPFSNGTYVCQPANHYNDADTVSDFVENLMNTNLNCPPNYCNSNGICSVHYRNQLYVYTCECFPHKTGPRCDIG